MPPGEITDIQVNGGTVKFRNLGRVGSYLDLATAAVPQWIANCTIPPYLLCDGSSFSAATYPQLTAMIGTNITPDLRGRSRAMLNLGTGRITGAGTGIDGNSLFAAGGVQTSTLITANLPPYTPSGAISGTASNGQATNISTSGNIAVPTLVNGNADGRSLAVTGNLVGNAQGGASTAFSIMQPTTISGITMIRAA
jgi:microcystin-dependent protein